MMRDLVETLWAIALLTGVLLIPVIPIIAGGAS